jgi:hypothetical protein
VFLNFSAHSSFYGASLGDYGLNALILDLMVSMGNKLGKGDGKLYWKLEKKKFSVDLLTKCQNNLKQLEKMDRKPVS